jgi:CTP:molybdopterin cytidylyltransferase MocA
MVEIDGESVLKLAHSQGQLWVDAETAARIASGAAAAVRAVREAAAQVDGEPLAADADSYPVTLEALAPPR